MILGNEWSPTEYDRRKIDRQLTARAGNLKNVKERWGGGGGWKSGNFYRDTNISIFNLFLGLVEKIGLNSPISF